MARSEHDADLAKFIAGEAVNIGKTLRSLRAPFDLALAVAVVTKLLDHPFWFGTSCRRLPVAVIRRVLAANVPGPTHLFLRLAVPADAKGPQLVRTWQRAVSAVHELVDTTHAWDSEPRRMQLAALAREPQLLHAIQGVVANLPDASLDMLAVLVADGSDASVDALIPHLDPALGERDARLERLAQLRSHARRTPPLDALFAELSEVLAAWRSTSPALAMAPLIGLGNLPVLWFRVRLGGGDLYRGVDPIQGSVRIDSRDDAWFQVSITRLEDDCSTSFDQRRVIEDRLELGRCAPDDLPAWLASAAKRLEISWDPFCALTDLDTRQRERIAAWLAGR